MHDRVADDRELQDVGAAPRPTCTHRSAISSSTHARTAVGELRLRARVHHHVATRGSSGPRRTGSAGSSRRSTASTSPLARSQRCPATVVDPTSNATPSARSRNPGQTAMIVAPSCTATVAVQSPAAERPLQAGQHVVVAREAGERPVALQRLEQPLQVARRVAQVRLADLDVVQPDDRVDLDRVRVGLLAHDLPVQLALRRHVDDQVADARSAWQPSRRSGASPRPVAVRLLGHRERREVVCLRGDPVLGELALRSRPPGSGRRSRARRRPSRGPRRASGRRRAGSVPCANRPRLPDGVKTTSASGSALTVWRGASAASRASRRACPALPPPPAAAGAGRLLAVPGDPRLAVAGRCPSSRRRP